MKKTLFKVSYLHETWSCARFTTYGLHYEVGVKTTPIIGKIFVFDNGKNAIEFVNNNSSLGHRIGEDIIIFEGHGTNPRKISRVASSLEPKYENFWLRRMQHRHPLKTFSAEAPKGTVVVDDFTPIKEYTYNKFVEIYGE